MATEFKKAIVGICTNPPAPDALIQDFETAIARRLPEDYRAYLLLSNGGRGEIEGSWVLFNFSRVEEILEETRRCDLPEGMWRLGSAEFEDDIVLDLRGKRPKFAIYEADGTLTDAAATFQAYLAKTRKRCPDEKAAGKKLKIPALDRPPFRPPEVFLEVDSRWELAKGATKFDFKGEFPGECDFKDLICLRIPPATAGAWVRLQCRWPVRLSRPGEAFRIAWDMTCLIYDPSVRMGLGLGDPDASHIEVAKSGISKMEDTCRLLLSPDAEYPMHHNWVHYDLTVVLQDAQTGCVDLHLLVFQKNDWYDGTPQRYMGKSKLLAQLTGRGIVPAGRDMNYYFFIRLTDATDPPADTQTLLVSRVYTS